MIVQPQHRARQGPASGLDAATKAVRSLAIGGVAFATPDSLMLGDTAPVELVVSVDTSGQLVRQLTVPGRQTADTARISSEMEAMLTGSEFEITANSPAKQRLTLDGPVRWIWDVRPKRHGRLGLHLSLSARLPQDPNGAPWAKTFDRDIVVDVTIAGRIVSFFESSWQWLTGIIVTIGVALWTHRRKGASPVQASIEG